MGPTIKKVGDKQESFAFIIDYHLSPTPFISNKKTVNQKKFS
jgi:hypothetical protein